MEEALELPSVSCIKGNPATHICSSVGCDSRGFICPIVDCVCGNVIHKYCSLMRTQSLMEMIMDKKQNLSQDAQDSYATIIEIVKQMINSLSLVREQLENARDYFALLPKAIDYLNLLREGKFDNVNGKLISGIIEELKEYQQPIILSKSQIEKEYASTRKQFELILTQFKSFTDKKTTESKITKQFPLMYRWIEQSMGKGEISHRLLYRASEHSFRIAKFHQLCDTIPNTLVIVRTEFDKVIGGFTPAMWSSIDSGHYSAPKTFIFSLSLQEKMTNIDPRQSIYCKREYGPTFGGHDIYICDQANIERNSNSSFPDSYNSNAKYERSQRSYALFSGQIKGDKFRIKQWEVFQIYL